MATTRAEIIATLTAMLPELDAKFGMHNVALFGSVARGDYDEQSDVDIVSDFRHAIGLEIVTICELIEAKLGRRVELIHKNGLRGHIGECIRADLLLLS